PHVSEHRGLQAAEGEVECRARAAREPARKVDLLRIAGAPELVDVRPARVRQTEQLGHFVESLARGVVESVAESTVLARRPDLVQRSVASGDDESEPGRRRRALGKQYRHQMPFDVVDADQRNPRGCGNRFRYLDAD